MVKQLSRVMSFTIIYEELEILEFFLVEAGFQTEFTTFEGKNLDMPSGTL